MNVMNIILIYLSLAVFCHSANRIATMPHIDEDSPPSVVWTEVIDERGIKLAALSFRVITRTMSDAKWATEVLRKAEIDYSTASCKVTILLLDAGAGHIDFQHARASNYMKKQYSKIKVEFTRKEEMLELPESNGHFSEDCAYIVGQGYAHAVCPIQSEFHCDNLLEVRHILKMTEFMNETYVEKTYQLKFEIEAQNSRSVAYVDKRSKNRQDKVYGVVAHVGLKNKATSLQVETWIRFHISRGFKLFLFDRYAFHRDIVTHALSSWKDAIPVLVINNQ